ncbi:hypothetical protein NGTWS1803_01960 [Mycolicibacterium cyprinidarum]|nr:hypothetical protein NGTWS1803_01960 [Mycolicibacterium sp. NGTWS1803]
MGFDGVVVGSNGELGRGVLADSTVVEVEPGEGWTPVQAARMLAVKVSVVISVADGFGLGRIFIVALPP